MYLIYYDTCVQYLLVVAGTVVSRVACLNTSARSPRPRAVPNTTKALVYLSVFVVNMYTQVQVSSFRRSDTVVTAGS